MTWFDVAPSYGDGLAESLLGAALESSDVAIITKVGLTAGQPHLLKRLAGQIARPLVSAVPGLRPFIKKLRPDPAERVRLTGETVKVSLGRSLERLKRDSVYALALHDPSSEDVSNDDVIQALLDARQQGLVKAVGIAGHIDVIEKAFASGFPLSLAQCANSPFVRVASTLRSTGAFTITHSVFGVAGALDRLNALVRRNPEMLSQLGYGDVSSLLLDYAFAANPLGVVLASSFNPSHLSANIAAAARIPDPGLVARVEGLLDSDR